MVFYYFRLFMQANSLAVIIFAKAQSNELFNADSRGWAQNPY
jgi:hypothetical protein